MKYYLTASTYDARGFEIGAGDFHQHFIDNNEFTDKEIGLNVYKDLLTSIKEDKAYKEKEDYSYVVDFRAEDDSFSIQQEIINEVEEEEEEEENEDEHMIQLEKEVWRQVNNCRLSNK